MTTRSPFDPLKDAAKYVRAFRDKPFVVKVGGDIITGIDNVSVNRFEDLLSYLFVHAEPGQTVKLKIYRDGTTSDVSVTLTARPNS